MKYLSAAFVLAVLMCQPLTANEGSLNSSTVEQWGMQEITLRSNTQHENPFSDVALSAEFRFGDKIVRTDGFYDGDQKWKIRFMPQSQGLWRYQTCSNDPALNGQKGSFEVGPPGPLNHGPVKVANTYHFSYEDGTPYFVMGYHALQLAESRSGPRRAHPSDPRQRAFQQSPVWTFPKMVDLQSPRPGDLSLRRDDAACL